MGTLMETLSSWFTGPGLPHGYCLLWSPALLWTLVGSDLSIGIAYVSISCALLYFIRRQTELKFSWMFVMFGVFIFACGLTHFVGVLSVWFPVYRLDATLKLLTAAASIGTAVVLWPLVNAASAFLNERQALEQANDQLRAELLENSLRDPLTQLFNRRFLSETLELDDRRGFAVVMFDLDHFKAINDKYGHPAGDCVLREFAKVMQATSRKGDVACRYGGEEFTLVLRGATLEEGIMRADQIRTMFGSIILHAGGGANLGTMTVSAGVAAFPANGDTGLQVMDQADRALYRAKHNGRNRTEAATPISTAALAVV
jgi:diguanylate cyclase (GGDEF)-like protein